MINKDKLKTIKRNLNVSRLSKPAEHEYLRGMTYEQALNFYNNKMSRISDGVLLTGFMSTEIKFNQELDELYLEDSDIGIKAEYRANGMEWKEND